MRLVIYPQTEQVTPRELGIKILWSYQGPEDSD